VAISTDTLVGANINDARASCKVWINEMSLASGHITAEAVPEVFIPSEELIRDVRQGTVDCFAATGIEFAKLASLTDPSFVVLQDYLADGMEYVLLVHSSSPFKKISDLKGAQILSHLHRDMVLLPVWLGTMLAAADLPATEHFFGSLSPRNNLNQVVLPVFFRRADGALLARRSWDMAAELNPQLGRDLRPLAVSPKLIPIVIGFRRNTNPESRTLLIASMLHISSAVAGRQIAALYQCSEFVVRPTSAMKGTVEMVEQYERLSAKQAGARRERN
jgi:ABC-type phosphate/phosphonate transport system substrate-binding protein